MAYIKTHTFLEIAYCVVNHLTASAVLEKYESCETLHKFSPFPDINVREI